MRNRRGCRQASTKTTRISPKKAQRLTVCSIEIDRCCGRSPRASGRASSRAARASPRTCSPGRPRTGRRGLFSVVSPRCRGRRRRGAGFPARRPCRAARRRLASTMRAARARTGGIAAPWRPSAGCRGAEAPSSCRRSRRRAFRRASCSEWWVRRRTSAEISRRAPFALSISPHCPASRHWHDPAAEESNGQMADAGQDRDDRRSDRRRRPTSTS